MGRRLGDTRVDRHQRPGPQIRVGHLNVNRLMPSIDDVNLILQDRNLDILCLSETFLSDKVDDRYLIFPGYVVKRRDRQTNGGGVCIIYRDHIDVEEFDVPTTGSPLECLWTRVEGKSRMIVGVFYRPPSSPIASVLDDLHHQITYVLSKGRPMFLLGDANLDILRPTTPGLQRYLEMLHGFSLEQLITDPTRTCQSTATLIDHIITSAPDLSSQPRVIPCCTSDHDLTTVNIASTQERRRAQEITIRSTRGLSEEALCLELLLSDWSRVYCAETTDEKWSAWRAVWSPVIDSHMPLTSVKVKHAPCPWLSDNAELRDMMRDRDRARKDRDRQPCEETWRAYRDSRNAVKRAQYNACAEYYASSYRNNRGTTWKDIRRFVLASKKPEPKITNPVHNDAAWAEKLNRHFVTVGSNVAADLSAADRSSEHLSPRPTRVCSDAFQVRPATLPELSLALRCMGDSRACGSDEITLKMLRITFPVVGPHLLHIINHSLTSGKVPAEWKEAIILPLYKAGDRTDPNNFRPISILPVVGKLCEKIVCFQLTSYLSENNILCDEQHGFRPCRSTETAMLDTVSYLSSNMDSGRVTALLTADTSKAFDSVEHDRLLAKLGWYGVSDHWFRDWLGGRSQSIRGSSAGSLPVTHGVIQGSILGPKLFLIFINDLVAYLPHGKQVLYADDVQFLDTERPENMNALKRRVEGTLAIALDWFNKNRLKINPNKTELIMIKSQRRTIQTDFSLLFGGQVIQPSAHVKILGIFVDSSLSWEKQVSHVTRRCYSILIGLSKLRHKIPKITKQLIIQALVFPHIQYCLTVWGSCNATQKHRIQKIINFAARIVTGFKRSQHITPALEALGWPRVDALIDSRDVAMLKRLMSSAEVPTGLAAMIQRRSEVSSRSTRGSQAGALQVPRVQTEAAKRSFNFRALTTWNKMLAI